MTATGGNLSQKTRFLKNCSAVDGGDEKPWNLRRSVYSHNRGIFVSTEKCILSDYFISSV